MELNNDIALTVPGKNQTALAKAIIREGKEDGSPRIMFIGNSLTLHAPRAEVGWSGYWGMAASCREKDYVHLVMEKVKEHFPNATFCIVNACRWETGQRGCDYEGIFGAARDFAPDCVTFLLGANVPKDDVDYDLFRKNMGDLLGFMTEKSKNPKFVYCTKFYPCPIRDKAIRDYAASHGETPVEMNDLIADETNLAIGLFEHPGVQRHPGDKGMRIIAERISAKLVPMLLANEGK